MEDTELLTLLPFLKGLVEDKVPDLREVIKSLMNANSEDGEGEGEGESNEGESTPASDDSPQPNALAVPSSAS